jgi:hypothetical protein
LIHSGAVYEENVRVPLLISNPKLFKGRGLRSNTVIAEVWIDGEIVFASESLDSNSNPQSVRVKVNGNTLSLVIKEDRDGTSGDHADWLEPRLELPN